MDFDVGYNHTKNKNLLRKSCLETVNTTQVNVEIDLSAKLQGKAIFFDLGLKINHNIRKFNPEW